jgi:hypothetical protein
MPESKRDGVLVSSIALHHVVKQDPTHQAERRYQECQADDEGRNAAFLGRRWQLSVVGPIAYTFPAWDYDRLDVRVGDLASEQLQVSGFEPGFVGGGSIAMLVAGTIDRHTHSRVLRAAACPSSHQFLHPRDMASLRQLLSLSIFRTR